MSDKFPVPSGNNGFGFHWLPQLADVSTPSATQEMFELQLAMGAKWTKLITSPGGDPSWYVGCGRNGAAESTFRMALDLGMGVDVRIFNSAEPPYWTPAVEANLKNLLKIAGDRSFYVECANEIDAELQGVITEERALRIVRAIVEFHDNCYHIGGGQIIPVFPSFGYGGPGWNWFELVHHIGRGEILDECVVAVHNYPHANRHYEPYDPAYLAATPLGQAEFDVYPWRYSGRTLEEINRQRELNAYQRGLMTTDAEVMLAYASGWFTYMWAIAQLDALGHTGTMLHLTETGERVDEMVAWEARLDPLLHMQRSIALANYIRMIDRIEMSAMWLIVGKTFWPIDYVWEDQCWISPMWDRRWNLTMPEGEYAQIVTPGRLPIVDYLLANPVPAGKLNTVHGADLPPDLGGGTIVIEDPDGSGEAGDEPAEGDEMTETHQEGWLIPEWNEALLGEAVVQGGQEYWKLVEARLSDDRLDHTVWVRLLDATGKQIAGEIQYTNADGTIGVLPVKAPPDLMDRPLWKNDTLDIRPISDGLPADVVQGLHTRYGTVPNVNLYHLAYELTFKRVVAAGEAEPEEPETPAEPTTWEVSSALITMQSEDELVVEVRLRPA